MRESVQKTITIDLPEPLLQPLLGVIDAGLRATGLRAAEPVVQIVAAIEAAMKAAARDEN